MLDRDYRMKENVEKSLSEALLAQKLAVLYDGGTKKSVKWCEFQ